MQDRNTEAERGQLTPSPPHRVTSSLLAASVLALSLAPVVGPVRAQEAPAAAQAQPAAAADARYQAAAELFTQKKYAEAAAALEKFLAEFPKHPKAVAARLQLGAALLETGKLGPAAAAYQAVLPETQSPDLQFQAHYGAGRAFLALKEDAKATEALTEAARLSQQDQQNGPAVRLLLGTALLRVGRPEDALKTYQDFLNRWPEHAEAPQASFGVGEANRVAGNYLEAAITFRLFTDKHWRRPEASQAALKAGDAFLALGRLTDAEQEYRRVLKDYLETPAAPRAQIGLGRLSFVQKDYASARNAYQAAGVVFAESGIGPEVELRIAETYLAEKSFDEARRRYTALTGSADAAVAREARYGLGVTQQADAKLPAATAEFTRLTEDKEAGRWGHLARLRLAEIRAGGGDHAAAVALIRPVLGDRPDPDVRDEASLALGEALVRSRDLAGAEGELSALLKRAPEGPLAARATLLTAEARLEGEKPAEAVALLSELLKKELDAELRPAALTLLGRGQIRNKQEKDGAATLKEVLEKHAAAPQAADAARALLSHYQGSGQAAQAAEIEQLIAQRYGGPVASADEGQIAQAERLAFAGQHQEALKLFTQLLDRKPEKAQRVRILAGMAESLAGLKKPAEASARVAELVKDAPAPAVLAEARYRVGRAHEKAGSAAAALAEYQAARTAGPEAEVAPAVLLGLGRLLNEAQKQAEAEAPLRELIQKYPKSASLPEALYELAWVHLDLGRADQARPVLIRLVTDHAGHPLAPDASFRVGEQDYRKGDYAAAAERYRFAAASKTAIADRAAYKLGWTLRQTGDHAGAAQAFLRAVEAAPQGPLALESRIRAGEAFLQQEKEKEALAQFQAVLGGEPVTREEKELQVQAKVGAALAYLLGGDGEKALNLASEAAMPGNGWYGARAQLVRAEAVFLKDGAKAAVAEFSRGASLYARHRDVAAEAWFRIAECHEKLGDGKSAQAAWQRVVDQFGGTDWANRSRERLNGKPAASGQ